MRNCYPRQTWERNASASWPVRTWQIRFGRAANITSLAAKQGLNLWENSCRNRWMVQLLAARLDITPGKGTVDEFLQNFSLGQVSGRRTTGPNRDCWIRMLEGPPRFIRSSARFSTPASLEVPRRLCLPSFNNTLFLLLAIPTVGEVTFPIYNKTI